MHLWCRLERERKDAAAVAKTEAMAKTAANGTPENQFVLFLYLVKHRPVIISELPLATAGTIGLRAGPGRKGQEML